MQYYAPSIPAIECPSLVPDNHADPDMPILRRYYEARSDDPKIGSAFGTVHLRLPFLRRDRCKGSKAGDLGVSSFVHCPNSDNSSLFAGSAVFMH